MVTLPPPSIESPTRTYVRLTCGYNLRGAEWIVVGVVVVFENVALDERKQHQRMNF